MSITVKCDECGKTVKAPDAAAGKKGKCPQCGAIIKIPELIYEAEVDDEVDFDGPPKSPSSDNPFADIGSDHGTTLPKKEKRKPCPVCGEMIVADAAKCRFCNEVFDQDLKKTSKSSDAADSKLSTAEIVVAILCANIGCILGIIWIIQGKPKGTKMLGIALISQVVGAIIMILSSLAQQAGR